MYYLDTESIGFYGPTVLIQWSVGREPPRLHNIWDHPVQSTLDLIQEIVTNDDGVVGFNLTHDWYHLSKTYNVLSCLPKGSPPKPLDYADVEDSDEAHDGYCLKPKTAYDLMLIGRQTKLQATLNQKEIKLRRVPRVIASTLKETLQERVVIPDIYFAKSKSKEANWRILPLHKGTAQPITPEEYKKWKQDPENSELAVDGDFVNIHLKFSPSTSLKAIVDFLGHETETFESLGQLPTFEEYSWYPGLSNWTSVFSSHLYAWRNDPRRLKYALNDVKYLWYVDDYLGQPRERDINSILACSIGAAHWRGYSVDVDLARTKLSEVQDIIRACPVNTNAPKKVLSWLHEVASPVERRVLLNTKNETLKKIADEWQKDNPALSERARLVTEARRAEDELTLLKRIISARRLYVTYKVLGTKSNRMSGGSEKSIKSKGSINPQGIKKGPGIRSLFPLANVNQGEVLCGGDFSGFEVSIAEAVYKDPTLREELLTGKKIHALFGASMYGRSYEEILSTADLNINDPRGYYQRAKRGFFALLYGAHSTKLAISMWISEEEAEAGMQRFLTKYSAIGQFRLELALRFSPLVQPDGPGSKITWQEPAEYEESILGFRRYFTLEWSVVRALYSIAQDPPEEWKQLSRIKVTRRDRIQTAGGAAQSAVYAAAFGIGAAVFRAAANHDIQSPGGEMTKELQDRLWEVQPAGILSWLIMILNIHDELQSACQKSVVQQAEEIVKSYLVYRKPLVPLLQMDWKSNLKNWGEK
jgi:hypothetical protein